MFKYSSLELTRMKSFLYLIPCCVPDLLQLPFSVIASLNGVHMFGKSQSVVLRSTSTQETTVVWKVREDR
jgi:hypothetical protein